MPHRFRWPLRNLHQTFIPPNPPPAWAASACRARIPNLSLSEQVKKSTFLTTVWANPCFRRERCVRPPGTQPVPLAATRSCSGRAQPGSSRSQAQLFWEAAPSLHELNSSGRPREVGGRLLSLDGLPTFAQRCYKTRFVAEDEARTSPASEPSHPSHCFSAGGI